MSADRIRVRAAAKINLHLGVGAPREDGFHPLETVYQAISLYDDVLLSDHRGPWQLDLEGPTAAGLDHASDNIVHAAAAALLGSSPGGSWRVHKSIPVAGGMAGGSADAAAALVAADRVHDLRTSDERLLEVAAGLGSDVPFALLGGTAVGTGRGEQVTPLADAGTWWWVVVPSATGLSTPAVYRHWDAMFPGADTEPRSSAELLDALATGEPLRLARALHNDLEAAACDLRPDLADLLRAGEAAGALRGIVSGSGPTCLFLCADAESAREVAGVLLEQGHERVQVCHGPVAGAHVVPDAVAE